MAQVIASIPYLPTAPKEYDQRWAADLTRAFAQFVSLVQNPGEGRNTFIVLTDLQNDDVGLEAGSLYKDGNVVKISVLNVAALRGASMSSGVGTVTVVTP